MKKKIITLGLAFVLTGFAVGGGIIFYLFNMPHRDIQAARVDYEIEAAALVQEYLTNPDIANNKFLQEDGESKILAVSGTVASVSEDLNQQKVVLLKNVGEKAGVSCTFFAATNDHAAQLAAGSQVTIKGVIRAGAGYDADLEMYEDVILEKCDIYRK